MKNQILDDQFLDYLDGTLSPDARVKFEEALKSDSDFAKRFGEYKAIVGSEKALKSQDFSVGLGFASGVMDEIERREVGFLRRLFMEMKLNQRIVFSGLATAATLMLVVKIWSGTPQSVIGLNATVEKHFQDSGADLDVKSNDNERSKVVLPQVREEGAAAGAKDEGRFARDSISKQALAPNVIVPNVQKPELREKAAVNAITAATGQADQGKRGDLGQNIPQPIFDFIAAPRGVEPSTYGSDSGVAAESVEGSSSVTIYNQSPNQAAGITQNNVMPYANGIGGNQYQRYMAPPQSPPISVAQEAISTFSIDVDTASYTNSRRFLERWQLPPPEAVRTEEFINYFNYNYPEQHDKPFAVHYEIAPSPLKNGAYLMKVGIKAKDASDSDKPWNLVFLVDVSGSMNPPNRLPLIKQALNKLIDRMRSQDRIAIVTYAGEAGLRLDSTPGNEKAKIHSVIDSLTAGGSTNGESGIKIAYDVATRNKINGGVNRVILATDGDFNVGVTSHDDLIKLIEDKRKSGVAISTIGVGDDNLNDATLEQLADKGNGNYFFIDSPKEADRVFEEKLAGTIETVAKDVKIQVEFNPKQVVQYKLIGYENRALAKEDFNNDAVDAGEIGSGHTVTALYELVLSNTPGASNLVTSYRYQQQPTPAAAVAETSETSNELAFVKIRFKEPDGEQSKLLDFPVLKKDVQSDLKSASTELRFAAAVAGFAEILRHTQLGNALTLKQVNELAQGAKGSDPHGERQEFLNLIRQAAAISGQPL